MFNYLNFAVGNAVQGDMIRAEPVREGTNLFSKRVEESFSASSTFWGFSVNWLRNGSFYEPDLFGKDLYDHHVGHLYDHFGFAGKHQYITLSNHSGR